jgi:hypothetical protein
VTYFNLQIGREYKPKNPDGSWTPTYHKNLYALTDEAARGVVVSLHIDAEQIGINAQHTLGISRFCFCDSLCYFESTDVLNLLIPSDSMLLTPSYVGIVRQHWWPVLGDASTTYLIRSHGFGEVLMGVHHVQCPCSVLVIVETMTHRKWERDQRGIFLGLFLGLKGTSPSLRPPKVPRKALEKSHWWSQKFSNFR